MLRLRVAPGSRPGRTPVPSGRRRRRPASGSGARSAGPPGADRPQPSDHQRAPAGVVGRRSHRRSATVPGGSVVPGELVTDRRRAAGAPWLPAAGRSGQQHRPGTADGLHGRRSRYGKVHGQGCDRRRWRRRDLRGRRHTARARRRQGRAPGQQQRRSHGRGMLHRTWSTVARSRPERCTSRGRRVARRQAAPR